MTARFAKIVAECGKPTTHLILMNPAKDRALQAAVKAHQVMTVFQSAVGNKTDRGKVGFEPGPARQYFVFPKSLKKFDGSSVVGIKYDLLISKELPKSKRAAPAIPPKKVKPKPQHKPARKTGGPFAKPPLENVKNVVAFTPKPDDDDVVEKNEEVEAIKVQVRRAMKVLEEGKAVAAFNLMKRIVEN